MEEPASLFSAHILFLDTRLALVHIPIHQYKTYLHPILQLLLFNESKVDLPFINISITPIEASIVLPRYLATTLFEPLISKPSSQSGGGAATAAAADSSINVAPDDYTLMCVSGSGHSASQRVLDLTTPLAMAGISIFFITTYFSDYILVPQRSRSAVIGALEARGFELSEASHDDSNSNPPLQAPTDASHSASYTHRPPTASSDGGSGSASNSQILVPGTPPPSTLSELQQRTFETLRKKKVTPTVDAGVRLVQCAGSSNSRSSGSSSGGGGGGGGEGGGVGSGGSGSGSNGAEDRSSQLLLGVIRCLLAEPRFLSLTLTDVEPPSLLLETRFLPFFTTGAGKPGSMGQSILLGSQSDVLVPIILDLRTLPLESTGIVCGMAGRLVGGTKQALEGAVEMSYLSTAQAGGVMVAEEDLDRAIEVLQKEGEGD